MKKYLILFILISILLTGCAADDNGVSYAPVVCEYTSTPTCWTVVDSISINIKIYDNNTAEVYCGDFYDRLGYDEEISIEYIYGETFEITEEQKQSVVKALRKNKIAQLSDCGDKDSCDGSTAYIILFDENGEEVHYCGGLNPYGEKYSAAVGAIWEVLPEGKVYEVRDKATEILTDYLLENYPEEYSWLIP